MKRPLIITVWAVFLTIATLFGIGSAIWTVTNGLAGDLHLYDGFYAFYSPFNHLLGLVIAVGVWWMRKWAFVAYVANQLIGSVIFWILNPHWATSMPYGAWGSIAAAAIFAATTFPYWRRMTWRPLPLRDASTDAPQNANS